MHGLERMCLNLIKLEKTTGLCKVYVNFLFDLWAPRLGASNVHEKDVSGRRCSSITITRGYLVPGGVGPIMCAIETALMITLLHRL